MTHYRGSTFVRTVSTLVRSKNIRNALTVAEKDWGQGSAVAGLIKASIAAGDTIDTPWAGTLAESRAAQLEFLEIVRPQTILGKLANLRRVPFLVPVAAQSAGATAYWIGEGKAKALTKAAFDRRRLAPTKIAGLVIVTQELLRFGEDAELTLRDDLGGAIALASDAAFIDASNTGVPNQRPAAVTAGALTINSVGVDADSIRTDVEAAIDAFEGNLLTAAWVMHPRTAVAIGLRVGTGGIANDLGARGGMLAGLPAITSEAVPYGSDGTSITLLDAGAVLFAEGGIEASRSEQATVTMTDSPGAGPELQVSLWQTEGVGILVERSVNWEVGRTGGVVVIGGVNY